MAAYSNLRLNIRMAGKPLRPGWLWSEPLLNFSDWAKPATLKASYPPPPRVLLWTNCFLMQLIFIFLREKLTRRVCSMGCWWALRNGSGASQTRRWWLGTGGIPVWAFLRNLLKDDHPPTGHFLYLSGHDLNASAAWVWPSKAINHNEVTLLDRLTS